MAAEADAGAGGVSASLPGGWRQHVLAWVSSPAHDVGQRPQMVGYLVDSPADSMVTMVATLLGHISHGPQEGLTVDGLGLLFIYI